MAFQVMRRMACLVRGHRWLIEQIWRIRGEASGIQEQGASPRVGTASAARCLAVDQPVLPTGVSGIQPMAPRLASPLWGGGRHDA